jgi:hypothetical protein
MWIGKHWRKLDKSFPIENKHILWLWRWGIFEASLDEILKRLNMARQGVFCRMAA